MEIEVKERRQDRINFYQAQKKQYQNKIKQLTRLIADLEKRIADETGKLAS